MKTHNSLVAILISVIVCVLAVLATVRSTRSTKEYKLATEKQFQKLYETIADMSERLNIISNKLVSSRNVRYATVKKDVAPEDQTKDWLNLIDSDLQKIEKVISQAGIDQLATNENLSASMLKEMVNDFAEKKKETDFRETLRISNENFHKADREKHDEKLTELYDKARFQRRRRGNNDERNAAFEQLKKDYPDSYATGMVIAENAIRASFRNNIEDMEANYKLLAQNENFNNIVIDWGIEAVPALQHRLANQYIESGRYDDAKKMIELLEENDSGSDYLFVRTRRRRGSSWAPKTDAINSLKNKMNR